jgi:choline monooxygenase
MIEGQLMSTPLQELINTFDPSLPLDQARTVPSSWYRDPLLYEAERRLVFGNCWQAAARVDQLREPGSFVTTEIAGEPILLIRDEEGTLRAFFNVCRHRAAPLLCEAEGTVTKLRCRYHGWTYDLAGRLRGTPEFDGVRDFRREEQGLTGMAVAAWGPMVWTHAGPQPGALLEFLAPLPEKVAGLGLADLRFVARKEYVVRCNWKVFVDNYLDGGYHVNTVHPELAGMLDYVHYRTEIAGRTSVQISPLRHSGSEGSDRSVRAGDNAYYWWVYPNFMINLYQGVMDTNHVLPLGPSECKVIMDFYFAQHEGPEAEAYSARSIALAHAIQMEDVGICEEVQKGLGSRSYDTGRFSVRREAAGYHFHRLLARQLAESH